MPSFLVDSTERNERYNGNWAQFMLDCESHPATTFNFCGGMKFGLSFTRKLREFLETKARNFGETDDRNVAVQESNVSRMYMMDGYEQSAFADNASIFHGREVRKVSTFGEKSGMTVSYTHLRAHET